MSSDGSGVGGVVGVHSMFSWELRGGHLIIREIVSLHWWDISERTDHIWWALVTFHWSLTRPCSLRTCYLHSIFLWALVPCLTHLTVSHIGVGVEVTVSTFNWKCVHIWTLMTWRAPLTDIFTFQWVGSTLTEHEPVFGVDLIKQELLTCRYNLTLSLSQIGKHSYWALFWLGGWVLTWLA